MTQMHTSAQTQYDGRV